MTRGAQAEGPLDLPWPIASVLEPFDLEMRATREVLECVAGADLAWRPHPRSLPLGALAAHIADIPRWTATILRGTGYDVSTSQPPSVTATDATALLSVFDVNVGMARALIADGPPHDFDLPWILRAAGEVRGTFTRAQSLQLFVVHHVVHHRGQLTVYLRLRDVHVPDRFALPAIQAW